jgi:hypothetical protein
MTIAELIQQVRNQPQSVDFNQVIQVIQQHYQYNPTEFRNGDLLNQAGTNEGSCKVFSFAQLQGLNEAETLNLFGTYYRDDVLKHPEGSDHGNIRNFIQTGWSGINFSAAALTPNT